MPTLEQIYADIEKIAADRLAINERESELRKAAVGRSAQSREGPEHHSRRNSSPNRARPAFALPAAKRCPTTATRILLNILINTSGFSSKNGLLAGISLTSGNPSALRILRAFVLEKHFLKAAPPYFRTVLQVFLGQLLVPSESPAVAMRDRHFSVWLKTSTGLSFGA